MSKNGIDCALKIIVGYSRQIELLSEEYDFPKIKKLAKEIQLRCC